MITIQDWESVIFDRNAITFPVAVNQVSTEQTQLDCSVILWKKDGFPRTVKYSYREEKITVQVLHGEEPYPEYEFPFTAGQDFGQLIRLLAQNELLRELEPVA